MTTASVPASPAADSADDAAVARLRRLRESVRGLGGSWRLAENLEQLLLIVGGILIPLGVVLIILGWWGAAHTPRLFEQITYAISGGLLGGSLVVAGGFLYFGYWLTKLVHEGRRQAALITGALEQLQARLGADLEALVPALEEARELAYRLYTICERKKRATEAMAYNGLVQSWPEITRLAREGGAPRPEQAGLFGENEE